MFETSFKFKILMLAVHQGFEPQMRNPKFRVLPITPMDYVVLVFYQDYFKDCVSMNCFSSSVNSKEQSKLLESSS